MPPTLMEEYEQLRGEALAITDKAIKEERQLSDDEAITLEQKVGDAKAKRDEHIRQVKATSLLDEVKGLAALDPEQLPRADQPAGPDRRSPGQKFTESESYKALLDAYPAGLPEKGDVHMPPVMLGSARGSKALSYVGDNSTAAGSTVPGVPPDFRGFIPPWFYSLDLFSVLTKSSTSSELVEYVREDATARVNAAAPVPEAKATTGAPYTAAAKPESAVKWVRVATPVRTIATWVPITTKALSDVPQMRDMIDAYLIRFLNEALASQIVNGDGTGENMLGLLAQATAGAASTGFAGLRAALAQAELVSDPNAWLMNPADVVQLDTQHDAQNRFYGSGPFGTSPRTLWGHPVVTVRSLAAGTVMVGDFSQAVLFDREQSNIQVGTINDQFTHNLRTLLAEERAAFGVLRPEAIVKTVVTWP